jgi:hypothetical protein
MILKLIAVAILLMAGRGGGSADPEPPTLNGSADPEPPTLNGAGHQEPPIP